MSVEFQFQNIGPIENAKMQLGDLTVIAGANNSGKTYLTYTLYGFLTTLKNKLGNRTNSRFKKGWPLYMPPFMFRDEHEPLLKMSIKNNVVIIEERHAYTYANKFMKNLCASFSEDIHDIFSSLESQFKGAAIECKITKPKSQTYDCSNYSHIDSFIEPTEDKSFFTITFSKLVKTRQIKSLASAEIVNYYAGEFNRPSPFILPAERFGVSLFYKELDIAKNRLVEELQRMSNEDKKGGSSSQNFIRVIRSGARYAKPIHDNIDFVRDLNLITKKNGDFADDKFFDDIKKMMKASYRYSHDDILFISQKRKQGKFEIPIHLASSSGKGLAGFYFYLRHLAKKGQLLIIDEPESHLDTSNQILLARLLARCVNAGLKIIITTHSDYIIKELNNLIMLSHDFEEKSAFIKKYRYSNKDYLNKEKVKPYICEDGTITPCVVDMYGMDISIFEKTIDNINNVSRTLAGYMPEEED